MRMYGQLPGQARLAPKSVRALLGGMLSVVLLAACGSSPTQTPSVSVPPSAAAAIASMPVPASAPAATPSSPASAIPTAASTSPAPSGVGGSFDACALLPAADLSKILGGEAVAKAMPSGGWAAGQCAWNSPTASFLVSVGTADSIKAFGDPAAPDAKAKLAQFKQQASAAGTPKVVAGIGDGAILGTGGMAAFKGGTYLEITRLRLTDDQLVKIMRLAVVHL